MGDSRGRMATHFFLNETYFYHLYLSTYLVSWQYFISSNSFFFLYLSFFLLLLNCKQRWNEKNREQHPVGFLYTNHWYFCQLSDDTHSFHISFHSSLSLFVTFSSFSLHKLASRGRVGKQAVASSWLSETYRSLTFLQTLQGRRSRLRSLPSSREYQALLSAHRGLIGMPAEGDNKYLSNGWNLNAGYN